MGARVILLHRVRLALDLRANHNREEEEPAECEGAEKSFAVRGAEEDA